MDLTTPESIESSVEQLGNQRIDILVNNAGVFTGGLLETQDMRRVYELLQVNLAGAIHATRLILPQMLARSRQARDEHVDHRPRALPRRDHLRRLQVLVGFTESLRRELDETG